MKKLVQDNKIVGILSNSTQLSGKEIQKLGKSGLNKEEHFHFLITSGDIAKHIFDHQQLPFKTPQKKFWLFGGIHPKYSSPLTLFEDSPYSVTENIAEADFIYISIPHINGEDQTDPNLFRQEIEKLLNTGLPMVCANPDRFAHEGNPPRPVVRQGSIAAIYEQLGGQVFYTGKPHQIAFQTAMKRFHDHDISNAAEILMVGDTPETDIRGSKQFGMRSALTTQTGMMAERINKSSFQKAIQTLSTEEHPDFFIERLGSL